MLLGSTHRDRSLAKVHDGSEANRLWQKSDVTVAESAVCELRLRHFTVVSLKHGSFQRRHRRPCQRLPEVLSEEEDAVPMDIGFRDVEIRSDQGNQKRVEEVEDEFREDFKSLLGVGAGQFCQSFMLDRPEPGNGIDLSNQLPISNQASSRRTFRPCSTSCKVKPSNLRRMTNRFTLRMINRSFSMPSGPVPQSS